MRTMLKSRQSLFAAMLASVFGSLVATAKADDVADFYRGRTVTIVVGHETGTGFDVYSRVLARHLGKHIQGHPNIVVQNMVGASGLVAANWLYNIAPKDGTVLMTFVHTAAFEPLYGNAAAKFDPARLTWIGNMDEGIGTCGVSKVSGVGSVDDLRKRETIFGGTGATGPLGKYALAVRNLLGAKIKLVSGYAGSASVKLAINRGEVHGICGLSLSSINSQWRDEVDSGAFRVILQLSGKAHPTLPGVPHVDDYARTPEEQQLFGLIFGVQALGRFYVSPPGMPIARMQALRSAFMATAVDPEFLADAARMQIDIVAASGTEVEAFIARVAASSPTVVERARRAIRND
jgi:tripartite-type tricarboxylate transporter receptor subunit TctC